MRVVFIFTALMLAFCLPALAEEDIIDRIAVEEEIKLIKLHEVKPDGSYKHRRGNTLVKAIDGDLNAISIAQYVTLPNKLIFEDN